MQTMMEDFVNGYKSGDITGGVKTFVGSNQEEQIAISSTQNISKPLKAYLNQIKNKHDVPVELRNLLGEYGEEAGIDNILISIVSTSSMMANQAMLNKMAHYGM
jgi:phosphopantetheine adenylyltransferase